MEEKTIEIKDLVVEYRTRSGVVQALNGLSLSIEKGKTLGLVGETGAGKTTAGLAVLGLIPSPPGVIVSGEILLNGKDLRALTDKEMDQIRGDAVAMIFQDPMTSLNPVMTVGDQIAEAIKIHEGLNHGNAGNGRNSQRTGKGISSSVFWRDETESCNRHCSFLYTGTSDRGRAHYGSGCDDPGPGSGDDEGVKGKI